MSEHPGDPLATFVPDARQFLAELAQNNTRAWFKAHQARYDAELKAPAMSVLNAVSGMRIGQGWGNLRPKLFRPHRDVRFSKDKTPYHTHLHMLWTVVGTGRQAPGLFFGIAPDYVRVGGGVMQFEKAVLEDWRHAVDGGFGETIGPELDALAAVGFAPDPPELKRVPAPFDRDHPHGELLRRKGLTVWADMTDAELTRPVDALRERFTQLKPLLARLQVIL